MKVEVFTHNPFSENTYVVYDESKDAYIIDPGNFHDFENEGLQKFISDHQLKVKNILLTHAHVDHVLGLQWAYDTYKVPVLMHDLEQEILDRNPMTAQQYGFFFKPFQGEVQYISEGDSLKLGNGKFKIYHVPGHSPGSIVFYNEADQFVVSGDALFEGSIGRTDLYKGNHEQLLESIRQKLFVLPDQTEVFSGHGNSTTIGFEKNYNPFF